MTPQAVEQNGVSVEEVKEILIHVAIYAGFPASRDSFAVLSQVVSDLMKKKKKKKESKL